MAYTITSTGASDFGYMRIIYGSYTKSTGDTSGTSTIGLNGLYSAMAVSNTAAVAAGIAWSAGTMTLYGASGDTGGYWALYGY